MSIQHGRRSYLKINPHFVIKEVSFHNFLCCLVTNKNSYIDLLPDFCQISRGFSANETENTMRLNSTSLGRGEL